MNKARASRRYRSVAELLKGEGASPAVLERFNRLVEATRVTTALSIIRHQAGVTQAQMAKAMGTTQSRVSKLEAGQDDGVTLQDLKAYAKVSGKPLALTVTAEGAILKAKA